MKLFDPITPTQFEAGQNHALKSAIWVSDGLPHLRSEHIPELVES
jgi:hypothetical protein